MKETKVLPCQKDTKQKIESRNACVRFIAYLKPTLQKFMKHNYVATSQDIKCHLATKSLDEGIVLLHLEIVENFSFHVQNDI